VLHEMLRGHDYRVTPVEGWEEFATGDAALALTVAPDLEGLTLTAPPIAVVSEAQLFGARARQERRRKRAATDPEAILRDLQDLNPGAPVVHEEYGVGRYVGLQAMDVAGQRGEFLVLEYLDGDRVYVPVQSLHLITRYTGAAPENAPLHKLGTDQWARARKRAAEQIRDVAAELLDLYARRRARQGLNIPVPELEYQNFANAFPFEETADQAEAIRQVLKDLASSRPMDRIICGDVGFGKTEVAMRAAFVTVQSGRQVAVLVPTTLLAQQHLTNFKDRFADWPVRIESLSRFGNARETQATLEAIEAGKVDIVIATHRLLHAHTRFKDLGLIVIDEEHRFGVRDKERLQALRAEVHVLTLTATPIPRTLNMALGGLRDLSLITTPPAERLAIKTFVIEWHAATLREAALRELRRGGQIYFVHNEVRSIERIAAEVQALVPEAQRALRARPDARARSGAADGGFLSSALQSARLHDHHRKRHRRAHGKHHHDQPRRPHGPCAAASAARPRRPLPPSRLCLSHRPAARRAQCRCAQTPGGDRIHGGARRRIRAGDARP
jgi:transcription-repair coupling factor (superfamily II helicase)